MGIFYQIDYIGSISTVESSCTVVELEDTFLMASAWANQTLALSIQNSGSLTATLLRSKKTEALGAEAAATGSDILKTGSHLTC